MEQSLALMGSRCLARSMIRTCTSSIVTISPRAWSRGSAVTVQRCCKSIRRAGASVRPLHLQHARRQHAAVNGVLSDEEHLGATSRLDEILQGTQKLLDSSTAPKEEEVLEILEPCEELAIQFRIAPTLNRVGAAEAQDNATSNLLSLDERREKPVITRTKAGSTSPNPAKLQRQASGVATVLRGKAVHKLSEAAHSIITDPKIFISPQILDTYINIQSLLQRPQLLVEALTLYAQKPVPIQGTSPIRYGKPTPKRPSSAVPLPTAKRALEAAIEAKILPLCLDIVETTVCTSAFRRQKLVRRALLPATAVVLSPVLAWAIASQFAAFQQTNPEGPATATAFAAIVAYVGFTGTIGFVALTTRSQQMERVTWAPGMALRERWMREEERAMMDRIAGAWGFREKGRHGLEEGTEWEALKELVGMRGMVLDRVEFMEGME